MMSQAFKPLDQVYLEAQASGLNVVHNVKAPSGRVPGFSFEQARVGGGGRPSARDMPPRGATSPRGVVSPRALHRVEPNPPRCLLQ